MTISVKMKKKRKKKKEGESKLPVNIILNKILMILCNLKAKSPVFSLPNQ